MALNILPVHEKKGLYGFPGCGSSNEHAQSPTWTIDMLVLPRPTQGPYFMSANSKGSGETALMRSLA